MTAAALIVGNEILSGKITDLNSPYLAVELRSLGVELRRIEVVGDDVETIAESVSRLCGAHRYLFTSGGVGPTHDDLTVAGVAKGLGREIVRDDFLAGMLREYYGDQLTEAHLRMANVPRGATIIHGPRIPIPVISVDNVYVLPGVPKLFRVEFESIRARFAADPFYSRKVYVKLLESDIVPALDSVTRQHPAVAIGSYPHLDGDRPYRVLVTLDSKDQEALAAALQSLLDLLGAANVHQVD